jgi:transposase-like protein
MFRTDVVVNEEQLETNVKGIYDQPISKSAKMKQMFDLGLDVKVIAEIMGVRYNFVYNVVSNYVNIQDIPVSKTAGESKKDTIIQLFLDGKTNKEIAKELKLNYNYIYKVIREFGEQSAASARAIVDAVKEANGVPLDKPFPDTEVASEIAPPIEIPVSEMEVIREMSMAVDVLEPIVDEALTLKNTEAPVAESEAQSNKLVRTRPPVEQTLWKSAQPDTKSGIAAFFANRRKA